MEVGDLIYWHDYIGFVAEKRQHGWIEVGGISGLVNCEAHELRPAVFFHDNTPNLDAMIYSYRKRFGFSPVFHKELS